MEELNSRDPYSRSKLDRPIEGKIVVMGNSGVGKTSLLCRYTQNKFDPKNTTSTSGASLVTKKVYAHGCRVHLQLWDTAGQERFRSMAPMYYRGANAALLLYDITNASTFEDLRGWLEELKKNCAPELIIYIVGSKADLTRSRQVTPDFARLSLHNWFPPPQPPPPPPPPPPSTLSYIRPRFTSFPSIRSPPLVSPSTPSSPPVTPDSHAYLDLPPSRSSALQRNKSTAQSRPKATGSPHRSNSATSTRPTIAWNDPSDNSSNSIEEAEEDTLDDQEWGLAKGMELFEVSAKDDSGIQNLFDHLISAIIMRKDVIERENELKRDSIFLSSATIPPPMWQREADKLEDSQKAQRSGSWNCC